MIILDLSLPKRVEGVCIPTSRERSRLMARVRQKDTLPELLVRKAAHRVGLRYRLHGADLPGSPDLVFPRYRTVLFVHGCFWHQHRGCPRCTKPKNNQAYWRQKFKDNRARDAHAMKKLKDIGCKSHIVWECEAMNPTVLASCLKQIFGKRV
jgi:DNA mismatch endonuclease (patch repair protein)